MGKIRFWTKKAKNDYCSYYLKDKSMMEELGVENNSRIEDEINNYEFSLLIDTLGFYEDLMRKYHITSQELLEATLCGLNGKNILEKDKVIEELTEANKQLKNEVKSLESGLELLLKKYKEIGVEISMHTEITPSFDSTTTHFVDCITIPQQRLQIPRMTTPRNAWQSSIGE